MIIPFGEFQGQDVSEVPQWYLEWLTQNCEDDDVRAAAEEELSARSDEAWDGRI